MAVQAQTQAFPHDLHAYSYRVLDQDGTTGDGSLFLGEQVGRAPVVAGIVNTVLISGFPRSDPTSCNYGMRKRARFVAPFSMENQRAPPALVPAVPNRAAGSGAASTSGAMANDAVGISQGLFSQLYHQGVEIDAAVRLEAERMRAGLEVARRRQIRALVSVAERAAAGRLRAAEAALELARRRNAKLSERLRQVSAEGQAWIGVAKSHEAVAAGLRGALDQLLLQSPASCAGDGDAEDARSCCFETPDAGGDNNPGADDDAAGMMSSKALAAAACKACGEGESCVLLLPCRHLCMCLACDAAVDACPVCAASKNGSLHVLLS